MLIRSLCSCAASALLLAGLADGQFSVDSSHFQRAGGQAPAPAPSATGPNRSQYPTGTENQQTNDPLASDRRFVKQAAEDGMEHIALGKLAQEKGSAPAVKEYGKRMVEDHTKANEGLKQAAAKANIDPATEMSRKGKKAQEKLAKLSGPEFDRAYTRMTLADHKNDVKEFDREAHKGSSPELKEFAAKSLPTHQEHLKQAEGLDTGTR